MSKLHGSNGSDKSDSRGETRFPRVEHVRRLIGSDVLLLPWPIGTKGTTRKWGHLSVAEMYNPGHLRKVESGNIGAALGKRSGSLCAVDLDRDDLREPFLAANPWARNTTEVRGARGCKFLIRIRGKYPPTAHLKRGEEDVAQWLADGAQAIVSGKHPDGMDYVFVNRAKPVEIEYCEIVWPEGLPVPKFKEDFTEQKKHTSNGADELPSQGAVEHPSNTASDAVTGELVSAAVAKAIPKTIHQNNSLLFQLARSMRDIKKIIGRPLSSDELKSVFAQWEKDARPFWRAGQSRDEYWFEFWDACDRARCGLEENPLPLAWEMAKVAPMPQEAVDAVEDARLRFLISFCRQMQILSGDRPFFIPTRWLGAQFGVSHAQAALWLRGLRLHQLIDRAVPGTETRCPRYFYVPLKSGASLHSR